MDEENRGRGIELDDVIHFIVTKKILSAGKTQKNTAFFLRCQNGATKTKMAKRRRKTKTSKTHLAAYVEVSLSQIQCGNLTAETVHF